MRPPASCSRPCRKTIPGPYVIEANYYGSSRQTLTGPATVKAVVFTNWGRPDQKRQDLTLRLDTVQSEVRVGTITIGDAGTVDP